MLSQEAIEEFKQIWAQQYRQQLDDKEALAKATYLLTIFKVIYLPVPVEGCRHDN